ncbi:Kinase superfamily protein isoform 1 [Hibiscus syriacus]|uniref:Kinase superfamily protein isoform 1 n=1 Tax=Hibiscus syriacus TaxID=106335 RepID=A0A6A2Y4X7_HIBSY|nr:Kinase superfamily protein isoform 1 [Hibiscus syriacus]
MAEPAGNENEAIVEEREGLMVSLFANGKPYLRTAHFLKPTLSSIDEQIPELFPLSFSSLPYSFQPKEWPLQIKFVGWINPIKAWVFWVNTMRPMYQPIWEKAGIFEAIMSSTCSIKRYHDLVFGLAEKWNPKTNTFFFPWGETTISLEDVMILGGYSIVGFPVTFSGDGLQLKEAEDKLVAEHKKIRGGASRRTSLTEWMDYFTGSGLDIEHEAFLSWGQVVALGPAVSASIYKDLTLLKETNVGLARFNGPVSRIMVCSPMKLVQLWAWERFPALQPRPKVIQEFDPRSARWNDVEIVKVENVRMVLDSAGENFDWRPYAKQYLPHRVAMQFGIDQDVPSHVARSNVSPGIAWKNYLRPLSGTKLYIPSRFFEPDITVRYSEWWKVSMMVQQDVIKGIVQRKRNSRKRPKRIPWVKARKGENQASVPSGFPAKFIIVKPKPFVDEPETQAFEESNQKSSVTTRPSGHDNCSPDKAQGLSPSGVDNGGSVKTKFSVTPTEKAIHSEVHNEEPARLGRESTENELEFLPYSKDSISMNGESNTFMEANMIATGLEARVAGIERVVSKLKAAQKHMVI